MEHVDSDCWCVGSVVSGDETIASASRSIIGTVVLIVKSSMTVGVEKADEMLPALYYPPTLALHLSNLSKMG